MIGSSQLWPVRLSVMVTNPARPLKLPMQLGPETAMPNSAMVADSRRPRSTATGSGTSPKPDDTTVALRAPAAAPSRRAASTNGAGTNTARWSGGSGSSA